MRPPALLGAWTIRSRRTPAPAGALRVGWLDGHAGTSNAAGRPAGGGSPAAAGASRRRLARGLARHGRYDPIRCAAAQGTRASTFRVGHDLAPVGSAAV